MNSWLDKENKSKVVAPAVENEPVEVEEFDLKDPPKDKVKFENWVSRALGELAKNKTAHDYFEKVHNGLGDACKKQSGQKKKSEYGDGHVKISRYESGTNNNSPQEVVDQVKEIQEQINLLRTPPEEIQTQIDELKSQIDELQKPYISKKYTQKAVIR